MPQRTIKKVVSLNAKSQNTDTLELELAFQDVCPLCNYGVDMSYSNRHFHDRNIENPYQFKVISIHNCPHCHQAFVTEHKMVDSGMLSGYYDFEQKVYPFFINSAYISDDIKNLSSRFVDVYQQTLVAKANNLLELYGMGLRKAFECLIKDYAFYKHPEQEVEIEQKKLAACVDTFVDNEKIKTLAKTCRLIGNNETHWRNKNEPGDIEMMERMLINLMKYIEMELAVDAAATYNNVDK